MSLPSAAVTASPRHCPEKVIWFVRHAQSNNNVYRSFFHSSDIPWSEPYDFDTRLSLEGRRQSENLAYPLARLKPRPEVIVVSPLTRTLETAELAFSGYKDLPRRVSVLSRERLLFSGEVGSKPGELAEKWPQYDFGNLTDVWWYPQDPSNPLKIVQEPYDEFIRRCQDLLLWLSEQPEAVVALVGHSLVFQHITGHNFGNAEVRAYRLGHLRVRDYGKKTMTNVWTGSEEPLCPAEAARVQPHMYK